MPLNGRSAMPKEKASIPGPLGADPFAAAIMKYKAPSTVRRRREVAKPETRSRCFDVLIFMLIVVVVSGGVALWKAPAHGLLAKVRFINNYTVNTVESTGAKIRSVGSKIRADWQLLRRTLDGELQHDNEQLEAKLLQVQADNKKLGGKLGDETNMASTLDLEKKALGNQLSEARHREEALHRKLVKDEKNLVLTQESMDTARMWQQSWHQKFSDSQERLGKARSDIEREHEQLQQSLGKLDKMDQQKEKLQADLAISQKEVHRLDTSERQLRGQLEAEREQRQGLAEKVHRFKAAELSLMKSLDIGIGDI